MRKDDLDQTPALARISIAVAAQGIAVAIFVLLFAKPELAKNTLYLVIVLTYAVVSIIVGFFILNYARKHSVIQAARRALTTAEPLPKPPLSERTMIVLLCLFAGLGVASVVGGIAIFRLWV